MGIPICQMPVYGVFGCLFTASVDRYLARQIAIPVSRGVQLPCLSDLQGKWLRSCTQPEYNCGLRGSLECGREGYLARGAPHVSSREHGAYRLECPWRGQVQICGRTYGGWRPSVLWKSSWRSFCRQVPEGIPALDKIAKPEAGISDKHRAAICHGQAPYDFSVCGGRKIQHLDSNNQALSIDLSDDEIHQIDSASPLDFGYLHIILAGGKNRAVSAANTCVMVYACGSFAGVEEPRISSPPCRFSQSA